MGGPRVGPRVVPSVVPLATSALAYESSEVCEKRIHHEFDNFIAYFELAGTVELVLLSDDFYSIGVSCPVKFGARVLDKWIELPHAIFVFAHNFERCFQMSFCRSTYFGTKCVPGLSNLPSH